MEILFWVNTLRKSYWLTWYRVSSGRHIGWLQPHSYTCPEVKSWNVWKLRFDFIYPSVVILASSHFWAEHWLITTKTLVIGGNSLTVSFGLPNDRKIMYQSPYMWKSCSERTPYGPHIDWHGVTSVQVVISADYDQTDTHMLTCNPDKFGYPKWLLIGVARDWDSPSKLPFDVSPSALCLLTMTFW